MHVFRPRSRAHNSKRIRIKLYEFDDPHAYTPGAQKYTRKTSDAKETKKEISWNMTERGLQNTAAATNLVTQQLHKPRRENPSFDVSIVHTISIFWSRVCPVSWVMSVSCIFQGRMSINVMSYSSSQKSRRELKFFKCTKPENATWHHLRIITVTETLTVSQNSRCSQRCSFNHYAISFGIFAS